MNWSLVKKDFMLLLKSPLTYIGVLSMVVILYITVSPYIKLYDDFQPDGETMEYSYDGNITDGYIPTPENERWEYVSQEMEAYLVSECEMSHEDAQKQMDEVLSKGWTVQEIRQFFIDELGFRVSVSSYKLFWCSRHKSIRFLHGCLRRKYVFYGNVLLYRYKSNAEYRACYRPAVLLLAAFDIYDHSCVTRNITAIQAVRGSCSGWLFNSFLAEQNIIRCMCSCFNVLESTSGKSAAGF